MGCSGRKRQGKWQGRLGEKRKLKLFAWRGWREVSSHCHQLIVMAKILPTVGKVYFDSSPFIHSFGKCPFLFILEFHT